MCLKLTYSLKAILFQALDTNWIKKLDIALIDDIFSDQNSYLRYFQIWWNTYIQVNSIFLLLQLTKLQSIPLAIPVPRAAEIQLNRVLECCRISTARPGTAPAAVAKATIGTEMFMLTLDQKE